jgi:hypothetical protein
MQTVTGGRNLNFSDAKVSNSGRIIRVNCGQKRKFFMLYLTAKSFSHQLQFMVKLSLKEVCLFHVFLTTTTTRRNINGVYVSISVTVVLGN